MNPMDTNLRKWQLLTEDDYEKALEDFGPHFQVGMGGRRRQGYDRRAWIWIFWPAS